MTRINLGKFIPREGRKSLFPLQEIFRRGEIKGTESMQRLPGIWRGGVGGSAYVIFRDVQFPSVTAIPPAAPPGSRESVSQGLPTGHAAKL